MTEDARTLLACEPTTEAGRALLEFLTHPSQTGARNDLTRRIVAVEVEATLSDESRVRDAEAERDRLRLAISEWERKGIA